MNKLKWNMELDKKSVTILVILVLFIFSNASFLWLWWDNGRTNLKLRLQINEKEPLVAALEPTAMVEEPLPSEVNEVVVQLPTLDAQPNWIYDMHSLILKTGVKVDTISYERTERDAEHPPAVQVLSTDVVMQGTLPQFISVIRSIQQMPRITHIEQWSINQGEGTLSYQLKLANYFNKNVLPERLESKPIPTYAPRMTNP